MYSLTHLHYVNKFQRAKLHVSSAYVMPSSGSNYNALKLTASYIHISHRVADKSLARPGRKQANVYVRMARISFGALPCRGEKKLDSSRLDVLEIARVPDMLASLFPSW